MSGSLVLECCLFGVIRLTPPNWSSPLSPSLSTERLEKQRCVIISVFSTMSYTLGRLILLLSTLVVCHIKGPPPGPQVVSIPHTVYPGSQRFQGPMACAVLAV